MKKKDLCAIIALSILGFIAVAYAGDEVKIMTGYVVNLEKEFVIVEDAETGHKVRVHFDEQTGITGKLQK